VDYQPISDPVQLQLLEHLLRVVLDGILLSIGIASVLLLGLCVSELRLPQRRPSAVQGRQRRASGDPMPEAGRERPGSIVVSSIHRRQGTASLSCNGEIP
jgi:hypothetical protein